jgi:ATP-dependent Clp protease ATP-binding subunit ClpA
MPDDLSQKTDWAAIKAKLGGATGKVFDDKALAETLKNKVIGQDKVADQIANQIKRRLSQVKMSATKLEKPLGVFLLAGAPGVGKTYFCKVLAENMYEGKGKLLHIDMTQFSQGHSKSSLIGSPQGYSGGKGTLTDALVQNSKVIILLDEFEKASPEVHKIFLTAWNDGFITDAHTGMRIGTTQALFLLTTNAAMDQMQEIEESFKEDDPWGRDNAIIEALKQAGFAPEVLSRIDHTFVFEVLSGRNMARMVDLEIQRLGRNYGLTVARIDTSYLLDLVQRSQRDFGGGGARMLARVLDRELGEQFIDLRQKGTKSVNILDQNGRPMVEDAAPALPPLPVPPAA